MVLAALLVPSALPHAGAHRASVSEGRAGLVHHDVDMRASAYRPQVLEVRPGEHVNFTNDDNRLHHVLLENSTLDSGILFPRGLFNWTVDLPPGNYTYRCKYLPNMQGKLVIGEPYPPNAPPVVSIVSPQEEMKVAGTLLVEGTADDPDKDWFRVRIRVNGGAWTFIDAGWTWRTKVDTTRLPNGPNTIEVQSLDRWNEPSLTASVLVHVKNGHDPESEGAPAIVITSPHANTRVSGEVFVEGIASGASPTDPIVVKVRVDDGAWKEVIGGQHWSWTWDSRTVNDGPHRIEAMASTGTRNSPVASVHVLVSNAGTAQMSIAILGPAERARVSGAVEVRGQAADPEGAPYRVLVRVDGGEWRQAEGTERWTFVWNSSLAANGPHVIEAVAKSPARSSVTARVTVFADNGEARDRPTVNVTSPQANQRLAATVLVQGRAASVPGTTLTVEVRVDDGPWENVSGTQKWAFTLNTTDLTNGVHQLHARSFDGRAHSEVATVRVLIANAPRTFGTPGDDARVLPPTPPTRKAPSPEDEPSRFGLPAPTAALAALALAGAAAARRRR